MWLNFIKTSLRSLKKNLSYALVNFIGLSITLAIFIALVLYIQFELSFDNFHENKERLYRVEQIMNESGRSERMEGGPTPVWKFIKQEFPEVEYSTRFIKREKTLQNKDGNTINLEAIFVDNIFLKMFSYELIKGDMENPLKDPFSIIITESLKLNIFGNKEALGQTIQISTRAYKVTAIMKDPPKNSHLSFNSIISISTYGERTFKDWGSNWVSCYVLMKPDLNLKEFNKKLATILKKWWRPDCENQLLLRKAQDIHLHSKISEDYAYRGSSTGVYILSALSLFILIMSGVNFTNLSIAYSTRRNKEVGMRKIIGASKSLLIKQFLIESILIVLVSLILAFLLFEMLLPWFNTIVNRELDFKYLENIGLLIFIIGVTILLGFVSAIYPAILVARVESLNALKLRQRSKSSGSMLRRVLVGMQFAISACFIIGALSIYLQVNYMKNKDLGYNVDQIVMMDVEGAKMKDINYFREQIMQNSGVLKATMHDYPIENSTNWTRCSWEGAPEGTSLRINNNYVDHYYTNVYEMEFVAGENFTGPQKGNSVEGNRCIINEAAVRSMNLKEPIGHKMIYTGDYRSNTEGHRITIQGVVKDFHFKSAHTEISPMIMILFHEGQNAWSVSAKISSTDMNKTLDFLNAKFNEIFPDMEFQYEFVKQNISDLYVQERNLSNVVLYLAVLAIVIACLGVYGLISFATLSRTKEIGIRKTLGSPTFAIHYLFAKEFLMLILIANMIAWPLSYFVSDGWLLSFPYRMPFSILPYAMALGTTIVFAILSMMYQIFRATKANPIDSLRYE